MKELYAATISNVMSQAPGGKYEGHPSDFFSSTICKKTLNFAFKNVKL